MTEDQLENWFSYHPPTTEQMVAYQQIRACAKALAYTINLFCPESPDKTAAIRKIREAVMTANSSIACYQNPNGNPPGDVWMTMKKENK